MTRTQAEPTRRSTRAATAAKAAAPAAAPAISKKGAQAAKKSDASTRGGKKASGAAAKKSAATTSRKRGLGGHAAPPSSAPLGVVDPASGFAGAHILNIGTDIYDIMLSLVDVSTNSDKYYLLQVIVDASGNYHTWARWGRTGTAGQSQLWDAKDEEDAVGIFEDKYKEKTGCEWSDHASFVQQPGKYKLLKTSHAAIAAKPPGTMWQYYVDDGVDGKEDGWYDYDAPASTIIERLHDEWHYNQELSTRVVASGNWSYLVDLAQMLQTNTSTHKVRKIRRVVLSMGPGKGSRGAAAKAAAAAAAPATPPAARKRGAVAAASASVAAGAGSSSSPLPSAPAKKSRVTAANVSAGVAAAAAGTGAVDPACPLASGGYVEGEYDVMLNQTDIAANKNKFYLAQVVASGGQYHLWTRWGRVGESGATQLQGPFDLAGAVKEFKAKFRAKTGNAFDDRADFEAKPGKYELIALMQGVKKEEEEEDEKKPIIKVKAEPGSSGPLGVSRLDPKTRAFIEFIFSKEMFKESLSALEIDVNKMPLGRLSDAQVQRGMDVLEEIEAEVAKGARASKAQLQLLSSKFYQVIPHSFGRRAPPVLSTAAEVQSKYDLCNVLKDVEAAQQMMEAAAGYGQQQHPADSKYAELAADLSLLQPGSQEHDMLLTYFKNTMDKGYYSRSSLVDVWKVERHGEASRFAAHNGLANRKLLWHGTNAAVAAAILKGGLRIMPHSGGRVGSGIYLADQSGKSVWYVTSAKAPSGGELGVMFLVEAALGQEAEITRDDPSLRQAPKGCDCVVARGSTEPDPSKDTSLTIDGLPVVVPQGVVRPAPQQYKASSFDKSEYLLYKESQHRIRYVLTVRK